jgi:hypothetical protein
MTTTRQYDKLNRLTQISTVDAQQSPLARFDYLNNTANQRTRSANEL